MMKQYHQKKCNNFASGNCFKFEMKKIIKFTSSVPETLDFCFLNDSFV